MAEKPKKLDLSSKAAVTSNKKLAKLEGRNITVSDEGGNGLYMLFTAAGSCLWKYRYRPRFLSPTGEKLNPTSEHIGPLETYDARQARDIALAMETLNRRGLHPRGWKNNPKEDPTLRDVFDYYIGTLKPGKSVSTYRSICQYLLNELGDYKVRELHRRTLKDVMVKHYTARPHAGRNTIAAMKRAFQAAEDELSLLNVPAERHKIWDKLWHHIPEIKHRESGSYKAGFSPEQWDQINQGFEKCYADPHIRPSGILCLEFMMYTGCRTIEAESLKWSEIGPVIEKTIGGKKHRLRQATKMAHKTFGRTGKPRVIMLAEPAIDVLERAEALRQRIGYTGELVFPSQGKRNRNDPDVMVTGQYFAKLLGQHAGMPELVPYNFRSGYINRTLDELGEAWLPIVSQNVGHASVETTKKWYRKQAQDRLMIGAVKAGQAMAKRTEVEDFADATEEDDDLFDNIEEDEYEPVE